MPIDQKPIEEELELTSGERQLVNGAFTTVTKEMNLTRIYSALYQKKQQKS